MATQGQTAPKADQPRVSTESLKRGEQGAGLTYRNTGIKNYANRGQRDSARKSDR
jgi:hypothetical protein